MVTVESEFADNEYEQVSLSYSQYAVVSSVEDVPSLTIFWYNESTSESFSKIVNGNVHKTAENLSASLSPIPVATNDDGNAQQVTPVILSSPIDVSMCTVTWPFKNLKLCIVLSFFSSVFSSVKLLSRPNSASDFFKWFLISSTVISLLLLW